MNKKGKFILLSIDEFPDWLNQQKITRQIKLIQHHHTYSPDYSSWNNKPDPFYWCDQMEYYHTKQRKPPFIQIAQNITTFPTGEIMICRPFNIMPAGIFGANQFGLCVENLGNFDDNKDKMAEEQKQTIIKLTAILLKKFNLKASPQSIVYHHWYDLDTGKMTGGIGNTKTCPGSAFFKGNSIATFEHGFLSEVIRELGMI